MDKINQEISNISNITKNKFQQIGNDIENTDFTNNNISNTSSKDISIKSEFEINEKTCEQNCNCDICYSKQPNNIINHINNNNFSEFKSVSLKNPDQLDIVVEKDNKQACCLIYNNNCLIF